MPHQRRSRNVEMESRLISRSVPKEFMYNHEKLAGDGIEVVVNAFRPSKARERETVLAGPSSEYGTEEWMLDYFSVEKDRTLLRREAKCLLPAGYERAYLEHADRPRSEGPIYKVRAWGVEFLCAYLRWCPDFVQVRDRHARDEGERARWDLEAVGWDLPGYFVIGSHEHPFAAAGPGGTKYVYDYWCSYEDALLHVGEMERKNGA
jgi:hypothetical protein